MTGASQPGETVVTEGQLRLTPGSHVQVQDSRESPVGRRPAAHQNQLGAPRLNISEVFIRRPIATSLLMAGIALFGVVAYRGLAVSDLPSVDFPTIQVSVGLPGADPTTMASAVATPLERQFTSIAGLDSMTSTSSTGNTQITLQFDLDRDIDGAAVDVQTAISEATPLLPAGLPAPPSFRKANPADQPIMYMALTSATLPLWAIDEYAETLVAQRLSMVSGVAQVQVWGSAKYAVRVQVDPDKLNAKQLGLNEIDTRAERLERQHAGRHAVRRAHRLQHPGQRPAHARRGLSAAGGGVAQWRAHPFGRSGQRDR